MYTSHSYWYTTPKLWEKLKPLAREMRHAPTPEENIVWQQIRNRQVKGIKFRRQYTIEAFIVDFFSVKKRLVIEIDGPIHDYTVEEDAIRQAFLESLELRVIRFTNDEVTQGIEDVVRRIEAAV